MAEDQNRSLQDKFMLRLPDGMRDRLKAEAEKNSRSMNAEIVARLERSMEHGEPDYQELKTLRAATELALASASKLDADLSKHLVISQAFCLTILNDPSAISDRIRKLAEDMHDVYYRDFHETGEEHRIHLLREIANVPQNDMDFFDNNRSDPTIGLTREEYFETRLIREAMEEDPDLIRSALDNILARGEEPTKARLQRELAKRGARTRA
jgi:phage terminase Nu1 subunit (DNA packaging protein)